MGKILLYTLKYIKHSNEYELLKSSHILDLI